jgi:glycosyltransferase involved in cell wall biosynthesis
MLTMRIGLDLRITYYTDGGIARYARRLASALPELAPEHEHVHLYRRGHHETFSARARRVVCWTPAHHQFERSALGLELLPKRLDLLHSPDFIPPYFGVGRRVITVHDLTFLHHPEFLTEDSRRYYAGNIRQSIEVADAIIAVSHATKADLVDLLDVPVEKVRVVHQGLDERFRVLPASDVDATLMQYDLERGYILFVGTFEPRKNVPGLLRAYAHLRKCRPDAPPLVLVGNRGWLFNEAARLMESLGLREHVRYFENLPDPDLPALYNGARVLALTSHYEGFGFPILEAMASGTPCVISDRSSLPEVAGPAALAVDPNDAEALANALDRLLTDRSLHAELRQRGLERAGSFSWERTARETLAVYRDVA